ncbi:hypothetical protein C8C83_3735 [Flavobacterium sp. 90]|uniref:hypothetical protein n=1 Tax=unclassified Flavobacterium TaxID=196869 RepID=UPI000EB23BDD|nr:MULTISPECIES: hypothetical protein [unclassified Flavobacterium]RKR11977.1 hypothetical protein C8C82_4055 [Flavobacterium sp. 81]TCK55749.1 hypothetical protein C8C83_3735 [Flavobacterium sp. 90]
MQQYSFKNNILNLKVKKSPLAIRAVMFFFTFAFFLFPTLGAIVSVLIGGGLQFGHVIGIGIFALMGFYLLRVSLWNTYGEETIEILNDKVIYEANYGWFKDGKKEIEISSPKYSFKSVGYEEDNEGVLVISDGKIQLESVVKIPDSALEELLWILEPAFVAKQI